MTDAQKERFWSRVNRNGETRPHMPSPCWLWTGGINPYGYGIYRIGRVSYGAHRVAWTLNNGEIPAKMMILHQCDVRNCVRPDHLSVGTGADNVSDMFAKRARGLTSPTYTPPPCRARSTPVLPAEYALSPERSSTAVDIPGFRQHGKPGSYRAGVILTEADAEHIHRIAVRDEAPLASVLRRAVRFYLATVEHDNG